MGQLTQFFGMPKVESSPTSPLRPLQSGAGDPAFSCLSFRHGSSPSLSVEVCLVSRSVSSHPPLLHLLFEDALNAPSTPVAKAGWNDVITTSFQSCL